MVCNPQANTIVERVHQMMDNMICTLEIQQHEYPQGAIPGILTAIAFGIHSTIHIAMQATPMQLVFGRDSILNIQHLACFWGNPFCYILGNRRLDGFSGDRGQ